MKLKNRLMRIQFIGVLFVVLLSYSTGFCEQKYQYEKKDKVEEQKKFVAKLKEDKMKTEMAIISTKALIDKSRGRKYLPELYLRLAELYIEKSRIVFFIRKNEGSGTGQTLRDLEVNTLKNQAIEIYQRILGNYPKFEDRDKVHFFLAHEYRELGKINDMIKQYRAIIKGYKNSQYVPEAYLLIGDHFFNAKQDLEMAQNHYKKVLNYPGSSAVPIARYKLAWCHINKLNFKKAITLLEKSVTVTETEKAEVDTYSKVDIRLESLMDMAYCYTEAYKKKNPSEALAYFQNYSWSRPVYAAVLEKLGYRYYIKKKYAHAVEIYRQLSILNHDPEKLLEYSGYIFECVKELGKFEDADKDMAYIIKALKKQKYSIHFKDEDKKKNIKDFELYARDIVTHLHHKARKKKSISNFKHAADSYKLYIDFFESSPVLKEMEINYAETLFSSKQYLEAGKQYEKLANTIIKKKKEKRENLYSAILSYYTSLKKRDDLNYFDTAFARGGLKTAGKQYVKEYPTSIKVPEILFNVAWISYDEGKYDEAIAEFSNFVDRYPTGKEAKVAVHLILDSYNLKEDMEGLIKYGQKVAKNKKLDYKLRAEVAQIVKSSESKVISSLTVAAVDDWEKGKADLESFVNDNKASAIGEQALSALIVSSKDKGDLEALFSAGNQFMRQYPKSPKIEGTLGDMIDASIKTSQFRLTAKYLEEFSRRFPRHQNNREFLYQAGNIRSGLNQYTLANKDYQKVLNLSSKPNNITREIIFTMAENAEKSGNKTKAVKILVGNRKNLSQIGKVKADAKAANLYLKIGNTGQAQKYRKRAYGAYKKGYAKKDGTLNTAMAQMVYNAVHRDFNGFMNMQLSGKINNTVVAKKAKLLEKLEKGYVSVIQYQSPEWALRACYRTYEINKEFAKFLKESPIPAELNAAQKKQYSQIIAQKSQAYTSKALQYLDTCSSQAHKWEVCNPDLTRFYLSSAQAQASSKANSSARSSVEIAEQSIKDTYLRQIHYRLVLDPKNVTLLNELARAYFDKGDYNHAILVAQKALGEIKTKRSPEKAITYNILGMANLYAGNDQIAKDSFSAAFNADSKNIGAGVNLAGIYKHYGHTDKAKKIYKKLPNIKTVNSSEDLMHPHAKELYYVQVKGK